MRPEISHVLPESSVARATIGGIGMVAAALGAVRHFREHPHPPEPARQSFDLQPGEVIEAESFLEVGSDKKLHFHGPDPGLPNAISIFDSQMQLQETG